MSFNFVIKSIEDKYSQTNKCYIVISSEEDASKLYVALDIDDKFPNISPYEKNQLKKFLITKCKGNLDSKVIECDHYFIRCIAELFSNLHFVDYGTDEDKRIEFIRLLIYLYICINKN